MLPVMPGIKRSVEKSVKREAVISQCGKYRYALWRKWDDSRPEVLFIGLNPATADDKQDDNTMRRCMAYATSWGFGGMAVANLFAYRTTYPALLKKAADPVSPENDNWLRRLSAQAGMTVAIWGNHGSFLDRAERIKTELTGLYCLKVTSRGQPHHTRGLPNGLRPVPYPQ